MFSSCQPAGHTLTELPHCACADANLVLISFLGHDLIKQGVGGPEPEAEFEQSWSKTELNWGSQLFLNSDEGTERKKCCTGDA